MSSDPRRGTDADVTQPGPPPEAALDTALHGLAGPVRVNAHGKQSAPAVHDTLVDKTVPFARTTRPQTHGRGDAAREDLSQAIPLTSRRFLLFGVALFAAICMAVAIIASRPRAPSPFPVATIVPTEAPAPTLPTLPAVASVTTAAPAATPSIAVSAAPVSIPSIAVSAKTHDVSSSAVDPTPRPSVVRTATPPVPSHPTTSPMTPPSAAPSALPHDIKWTVE